VVVCIGSRLIVALPDREPDLGRVDPEAQIIVLREQGSAGPIYDFKVGDIVEPSSQAAGIGSSGKSSGDELSSPHRHDVRGTVSTCPFQHRRNSRPARPAGPA